MRNPALAGAGRARFTPGGKQRGGLQPGSYSQPERLKLANKIPHPPTITPNTT